MIKQILLLVLLLNCLLAGSLSAAELYEVSGRVIDRNSRLPVPDATVSIFGRQDKVAYTDTAGVFTLHDVAPGIYRLSVTCFGYKNLLSPEYIISSTHPIIELELEESVTSLGEVTVQSSVLRKVKETPVSMQIIGLGEIEKSPGGNRDISRIIRSYPGVSFSVGGYRNDLLVRGGSPGENRFYLDGVEIPNINHFATQGASGGATSILNADMIREVQFYSGVFPVDKSGGLSSVMDIKLRSGNADRRTTKATLGASEVSLSGTGHLGGNTTYLFSLRQSYLQLLFKVLGLPFLPNFIDGQVKVKSRLGLHDDLTIVGLAGIDDMKLNKDQKGEDAEYILSYLPRITQQTFTLGAVYRHYAGVHIQSVTVGYNYLGNQNLKYLHNDESSPLNKTLDLTSTEQKLSLKAENRTTGDNWSFLEGVEGYMAHYHNSTFQRLFTDSVYTSQYRTNLLLPGWGLYGSAAYKSDNERFTATLGLRWDGCSYSARMAQMWRTFSPRLSLSWRFAPSWSVGAGAGIFHQLPPYTALGFKDRQGTLLNKGLRYIEVKSGNLGVEYNANERLIVSVEAFYKYYTHAPLSVTDGIPLACKGTDYGAVGNERLTPTAQGRAYGVEGSLRWQIPSRLSLVSSLTLYRCDYRGSSANDYIASAWDNRFIANLAGTYFLGREWNIGVKVSAIGGAPYTPYDVDKSSLVKAWDVRGRPYFDYSQYNQKRLDTYAQLDVRVDKMFFFRHLTLGFYIDIQNLTKSNYREQDVLMSTGVVANPQDDADSRRYVMKYIKQESNTLLPTLGVSVEF